MMTTMTTGHDKRMYDDDDAKHVLMKDHASAKAVIRLSLDLLRRRDDDRSKTVYTTTSLIFESFVNVWHYSYVEKIDSLKTHQWKKLPITYDLCLGCQILLHHSARAELSERPPRTL